MTQSCEERILRLTNRSSTARFLWMRARKQARQEEGWSARSLVMLGLVFVTRVPRKSILLLLLLFLFLSDQAQRERQHLAAATKARQARAEPGLGPSKLTLDSRTTCLITGS